MTCHQFPKRLICTCMLGLCLIPIAMQAHHFQGLPHYNYYENYPEVPEGEFLAQAGDYEVSLVVYNFQAIQAEDIGNPDTAHLFLVVFNLRSNDIYGGPLTLELLDGGRVIHRERHKSSGSENLYSMYQHLPETEDYSMRLTLHSVGDLQCEVPFKLPSQNIHLGKWIAGVLLLLIVLAAVGARRARIAMEQKEGVGR